MTASSSQENATTASATDVFAELAALGAATIHEAQGKAGALSHEVKPLDPTRRLAGRALTVLTRPGDNRALHLALLEARPGDVLVVDAFGWKEAGVWGDVLTAAAQQKRLAGVIVNGAVRDADTIIELGFPVFAKALSIKGTAKDDAGIIGGSVTIDGVTITTGDVVVGDRDGVVAIPRAAVETVLADSRAREQKEDDWVRRIAEGAPTVDLLNLR